LTQDVLISHVTRIHEYKTLKPYESVNIDHDILYDTKAKYVLQGGERIILTHLEIILLELFLSSRGTIIDYQTIEYKLYGSEEASRNGLSILISRLRKKLPNLDIRSIANVGYILP
jgi:DNA-binding response OmpR family regulator